MKHLALATKEQWAKLGADLGGAAHYVDLPSGKICIIVDDSHVPVPAEFELLPHLFVGSPLADKHVAELAHLGVKRGAKPADALAALGKQHPLFKF